MVKKLIRDESGIALGLAVIMIVLIGVMGAGLLVFVRNDLEAVIEVNNGQKALDIADSGIQVARQQIQGDKTPAHYDVEEASLCNTDENDPDDSTDNSNDTQRSPSTENWSPGAGGQTRNFADGKFTVTIQWLSRDSSAPAGCIAPETTATPEPSVDYFKVVSTGEFGNAKRRLEAIYDTYDLNVPRGYFTPNTIDVRGSAEVSGVSLFSLSDITVGNGAVISGEDNAYGNWKNSVNPTPRPTTLAGLGAAGTITRGKVSDRDYDKDTCPKLVKNLSEFSTCSSPDKITFPFNPGRQPDINLLREEAIQQERDDPSTRLHYYTPSNGTFSIDDWPANSTENTVVFVDYSGASSNLVKWNVPGDCTDNLPKKGTLVVRNGNFTTQPRKARFQGVVIVRGGEALDETAEGTSDDTSKTCLEGFVNASGAIKIAGNATSLSTDEFGDRPGFYGVRQWSWRELYQ